jgi:hypothetical protein
MRARKVDTVDDGRRVDPLAPPREGCAAGAGRPALDVF